MSVTERSSGTQVHQTWAHLRLGMNYLSCQEYGPAIVSLQSVLRTEPQNVDAWESLADAYAARGSLHAALKAYEKVLTLLGDSRLGEDGLYARLQVATINYKTGHFEAAIQQLRDILQVKDDKIGNR